MIRVTFIYTIIMVMVAGTCDLIAQDIGEIRFLIDPGHNFEYIVDHKERRNDRVLEIASGQHHFTVWAPNRLMVDTIVQVEKGIMVDLIVRLPVDPEFYSYLQQQKKYNNKRVMQRAALPVATLGAAIWSYTRYITWDKAEEQLQKDEERYSTLLSPVAIAELKTVTISEHNKDLQQAKNRFITSSAITGGLAILSYWAIKRSRARLRPPVIKESERIRFDGLTWYSDPQLHGHQVGVKFAFR